MHAILMLRLVPKNNLYSSLPFLISKKNDSGPSSLFGSPTESVKEKGFRLDVWFPGEVFLRHLTLPAAYFLSELTLVTLLRTFLYTTFC